MKNIQLLLILFFLSCNNNSDKKSAQPIQTSQVPIASIKPKGEIDDNGNKIGEWVYYFPSGELKKTGFFINGKKEEKWKGYHKNGNIRYIEEYQNDLENGKWLSFDEDGELLAKGFQKNGKKDGKWITHFYDNGKVHIEEFYKQGKPIGSINVYLPNGKLLESTFYTDYDYYGKFDPHTELDRMAKLAESMGIYDHNVEAYHRAIDAGDRGDIDAYVKALYDIDPTLDLDY